MVTPLKEPARMAIEVSPTCRPASSRPGSSASAIAARAPALPSAANASNRVRREEMIANSDIARKPLNTTSNKTTIISSSSNVLFSPPARQKSIAWSQGRFDTGRLLAKLHGNATAPRPATKLI